MPPLHHGEFHHLFGRRFHPWTIRRCWPGWLATPPPKGVPVLISNHDIEVDPRALSWRPARRILVKRTISRNGGGRNKVAELLALYPPASSPNRAIIPVRRSWLPSAE